MREFKDTRWWKDTLLDALRWASFLLFWVATPTVIVTVLIALWTGNVGLLRVTITALIAAMLAAVGWEVSE